MATLIQQRRDTAAHWNRVNPILADGEVGYETDTRQRKLGDGITHWNDLPYDGNPCLQEMGTSEIFPMSQNAVTKELEGIGAVVNDILIDYGTALSKYGGSQAIDYGNASTE